MSSKPSSSRGSPRRRNGIARLIRSPCRGGQQQEHHSSSSSGTSSSSNSIIAATAAAAEEKKGDEKGRPYVRDKEDGVSPYPTENIRHRLLSISYASNKCMAPVGNCSAHAGAVGLGASLRTPPKPLTWSSIDRSLSIDCFRSRLFSTNDALLKLRCSTSHP